MSGLRTTDPYRPETAYTFTVRWLDGAGTNSVTAAPVILDTDKYVGQAGAHSYYLDPSSYIGLVNTPPSAPGTLTVSFSSSPDQCSGAVTEPAATDLDFGTYRLQRSAEDGSWAEVDAWQSAAAFSFSDTGMTSTDDSRYRVVSEDLYGGQSIGPEATCVGSARSGTPGLRAAVFPCSAGGPIASSIAASSVHCASTGAHAQKNANPL